MYKNIFSLLICLVSASLISAQELTIELFQYENFKGKKEELSIGMYNYTDFKYLKNDQVRSIRVPKGLVVRAYFHSNYGGEFRDFKKDEASLGDWDQVISSLVVMTKEEYGDEPSLSDRNVVKIFSEERFKGRARVLKAGKYSYEQFQNIGDNNISSIRIPKGWKVKLYSDFDFRGPAVTYQLTKSTLGGWNNRVSSLEVIQDEIKEKGNYSGAKVIIYKNPGYKGMHLELTPGFYDYTDFNHIGNDAFSSINI